MKRILITGGHGMFASDMVRVAESHGFEVFRPGHQELDVTDEKQVRQVFETIRPKLVVHTVGLLVDFCETNPEEAKRVHVGGTALVAKNCKQIGATLVNLSTCGLFGDERRFYSEDDAVVLKTEYARTKFQAEEAATRNCERTFNIRPGWLFGGSKGHKKNFVYQRYLEAKSKPVLKSAGDKFGCPTYTADLAEAILHLLETKEYGLYHVTNSGGGSRYDYVSAIVKAFGLVTPVEPVDSSHYPRPAPVPDCELLENRRLKALRKSPLPDWHEALERYIRQL